MKTAFDPRVIDIRYVEAEAFRAGANCVPKEPGLREIAACFARQKEGIEEQAAPVVSALEAKAATLRASADEASEWWDVLKQKHGEDLPRWFGPLILLVTSVVAIAAEAVLLAPMLDMVGVADPEHQLWLAVGIIIAASGFFHWCLLRKRKAPDARWPLTVISLVLLGLACVGLFRAEQMTFAATASGSLFGEFLKQHSWLKSGVFVFLTLLFPVAATLVPHSALDELHEWWQYRQARRRVGKFAEQANHAEKRLQGEQEELQHKLAELDQLAEEWKAAYESFYELGKQVGARQRPRWTVWAKAVLVGGLTIVASILAAIFIFEGLTSMGAVLSGLLGVSSGLGSAAYFHRRWAHPSPKDYLKLANLQFRNATEVALQHRLPEGSHSVQVAVASELPGRFHGPVVDKTDGTDDGQALREAS